MSNRMGNHNKGARIMMVFVVLCMLISGLFFVVVSMIPVDAASIVIPLKCVPTKCTPTPTKTPTPTPTKPPTPSPTPRPTPKPTSTPSPTPTRGPNPTPTPPPTQPSGGSTPTPIPTSNVPLPPATATALANQTPAAPTTTNSSGGNPPPGGNNSGGSSGGNATGIVFTFAALILALAAFLLYLIPQGQSSLLVRLLSLVLPTSVARRFGTK
ncbi:MAG TPA: hypothetical protein VNG51_15205 [Ktedonobacteraceae bacterium]|nr:hypothetical protein [Ktedonobacteraceae bacterium]